MFKIQEKGKPETAIWLNNIETVISNDSSADIEIQLDGLSGESSTQKLHVEDDKIYFSDLSFNVRILINDKPLDKGARKQLYHGDSIAIQDNEFEIINPKQAVKNLTQPKKEAITWQLIGDSGHLKDQVFEVQGKCILGRDKSCDVTIAGSHLSRHHAELMVAGRYILMRDLKSANGCYVNGEPKMEAHLTDGDIVTFDTLSFRVKAPEGNTPDLRRTVLSDAITDEQIAAARKKPAESKEWVTKSTSVGNQLTDSDILLEKHLRDKKIIYLVFGTACLVSIFGTAAYIFLQQ